PGVRGLQSLPVRRSQLRPLELFLLFWVRRPESQRISHPQRAPLPARLLSHHRPADAGAGARVNEPPGEQLLALFEQVEANWENEAAHRAVLEQCETPEQLRQVARRYREWSQDPDRAERARRQLDAITA